MTKLIWTGQAYLFVVRKRRYSSLLAWITASSDVSNEEWFMHHMVSSRVCWPVMSVNQELTLTNVSKLLKNTIVEERENQS